MEPEREVVPAPETAPAAATAAPAAAPMGFSPAGSMTPASVLALQRSAGNSAVTNMLMRQDKTPVTGPGDFNITGGEPQSSGTVTAKPDGDGVRAESPDVKYSVASVTLKPDKTLEGAQNFGFIQNLVSSNRGTVYRRGGDPNGELVKEHHEGQGKAYDAVSGDKDGELNKGVYPPFYWPHSTINDDNVEGNPATTDPAAHDQPGFTMAKEIDGGGRLTEFKGEDKFKLGVGVKKGEAVHMLKAHDWSVPWAIKVDKDLNGAGKAVESSQVQDALRDGPDASLKNWSLAKGAGHVWEGFSTPEEANNRTASQLMDWLLIAKEHDPVSYQNICAALDSKATDVSVTVTCDTTHANFSDDAVSLSVLRDGALIRSEGGLSMNNGDSHTMKLGWAEAFGSAAAIKGGTVLKVEAYVTGNRWEIGHGFMPPFRGSSPTLTPGDGKYSLSVSI